MGWICRYNCPAATQLPDVQGVTLALCASVDGNCCRVAQPSKLAVQSVDRAVPKTILALMNVEGLTRENVASHLQKYRAYLKRLAGLPPSAPLPSTALPVLQQVADHTADLPPC